VRFRSKKREQVYRQRRPLVVRLLEEFPICQRCGTNPSVDIHEVVRRSQGGSILDPANLRALCRRCHMWVTEHPKQAEEEGFSAPSWQRDRYLTDWEVRPE
jgi:5-methylcytosine-specific restriction endonuclease McrA